MHFQTLTRIILDSGMTQKQIGDAIGLKQHTISMIASGATKAPSGQAAIALEALARKVLARKLRAAKKAKVAL